MFEHRLCTSSSSRVIPFGDSFSCFDFIEKEFGEDYPSIHRCFSLARSFESKTLVFEELSPCGEGIIYDENTELKTRYPNYSSKRLCRLSFWTKEFISLDDLEPSDEDFLIGYAIVKNDFIPSLKNDYHVFEAVFKKYSHKHNYIRKMPRFRVRVGKYFFYASGAMYAQQNGVSKCCAHVALYTVLANNLTEKEPSFSTMTRIVNGLSKQELGLNPDEIRKILDYYGIKYHDISYEPTSPSSKDTVPFNKLIYAGIESGGGALIGFQLSNGDGHIIPFFGHTFNKDTWVSEADLFYFKTGLIEYSPSENWTSSFIGHDDNFGPNLCVPKLYLNSKQVSYVIEVLRPGVTFSGAKAEIIAYQQFYYILRFISETSASSDVNRWTRRVKNVFECHRVVLRTISLKKEDYLEHIRSIKDGDNHIEQKKILDILADYLPSFLWLTEFSLPQLFPANERKVGEIIIDATQKPDDNNSQELFLAARFPQYWFFPSSENGAFLGVPSAFSSHTPNFC